MAAYTTRLMSCHSQWSISIGQKPLVSIHAVLFMVPSTHLPLAAPEAVPVSEQELSMQSAPWRVQGLAVRRDNNVMKFEDYDQIIS